MSRGDQLAGKNPPKVSKELLAFIERLFPDNAPPVPDDIVLASGQITNLAETLLVQLSVMKGRREVIERLRLLRSQT